MSEKGNTAYDFQKRDKLLLGNRFYGLQMVQFECSRVIPFVVPCGVFFSVDAEKGKCCMSVVKKVGNNFSRIGFMDCKIVQFGCSRVLHPFGPHLGSLLE